MGGIQYYPSVGSTNDVAIQWAERGANDFSLVIADEQTNGRGRSGRRWFTNPGSGLAFSLILRPRGIGANGYLSLITRHTGLGALAVCQVLKYQYFLPSQIKWPNDVLIKDCKCCGVLVETQWCGDQLVSIVLGIGINFTQDAIPTADSVKMTATSVDLWLSTPVDRLDFLYHLLMEILDWRSQLWEEAFLEAWESSLAFIGKQVAIRTSNFQGENDMNLVVGQITGLEKDGGLKLRTLTGEDVVVRCGEIEDWRLVVL